MDIAKGSLEHGGHIIHLVADGATPRALARDFCIAAGYKINPKTGRPHITNAVACVAAADPAGSKGTLRPIKCGLPNLRDLARVYADGAAIRAMAEAAGTGRARRCAAAVLEGLTRLADELEVAGASPPAVAASPRPPAVVPAPAAPGSTGPDRVRAPDRIALGVDVHADPADPQGLRFSADDLWVLAGSPAGREFRQYLRTQEGLAQAYRVAIDCHGMSPRDGDRVPGADPLGPLRRFGVVGQEAGGAGRGASWASIFLLLHYARWIDVGYGGKVTHAFMRWSEEKAGPVPSGNFATLMAGVVKGVTDGIAPLVEHVEKNALELRRLEAGQRADRMEADARLAVLRAEIATLAARVEAAREEFLPAFDGLVAFCGLPDRRLRAAIAALPPPWRRRLWAPDREGTERKLEAYLDRLCDADRAHVAEAEGEARQFLASRGRSPAGHFLSCYNPAAIAYLGDLILNGGAPGTVEFRPRP